MEFFGYNLQQLSEDLRQNSWIVRGFSAKKQRARAFLIFLLKKLFTGLTRPG